MIAAETHRLVLRWLQPSDLPALAGLLAHPEVMRFSAAGPLSARDVRELITRFRALSEERGLGHWAIWHKADKRVIGCCGLLEHEVEGKSEIEIGYRLDPRYWGRGFATEAAKACRDYGFLRLRLERLIALTEPHHLAAIRVLEKLGMKPEREAISYEKRFQVYGLPRSQPARSRDDTPSVSPRSFQRL